MVMNLRHSDRKARKVHHCGMCGNLIRIGEIHHVSTNVYDGRVYDWRECVWCDRDSICRYVTDWSGGYQDEGVGYEQAQEWADGAVSWPTHWLVYGRSISATERTAARSWLARAAGGEGE